MRVLITGATGMLGVALCRRLDKDAISVYKTSLRGEGEGVHRLDIRDWQVVQNAIKEYAPSIVMHLAAETNVDLCEQDPDHAYHTNAVGTENIAWACREYGCALAYISTANVFDGAKEDAYTEFDPTGSVNVYGRSKMAGEALVADIMDQFYIFRAGWMVGGWEIDKKFVYKIVQQCRTQSEIKVVDDKFGSPTFTGDFAENMLRVIRARRYGLYHLVNKGTASRYEIALEIVAAMGKENEVKVLPINSASFPLPAPRPRSERLRNFKLQVLGLDDMPHWKDSLRRYIEENKDKE